MKMWMFIFHFYWTTKMMVNTRTISHHSSVQFISCDMNEPLEIDVVSAATLWRRNITSQFTMCIQRIIRLRQIQNSRVCAIVKATNSCHITPVFTLSSLAQNNWMRRIQTTSSLFNLLAALALHRHHTRSATCIILVTYNWSFLLMSLTLCLESTPYFPPSNSSQFLYLWIAFSCSCHILILPLLIHHSHHP